jgi:hypothetical protein
MYPGCGESDRKWWSGLESNEASVGLETASEKLAKI